MLDWLLTCVGSIKEANMPFRVIVYSLWLHDGYCQIADILTVMTIYALTPELALQKAQAITDLHCELEVIK